MSWLKISTWRPKHLLISWCGYWALLLLGIFAQAIPALIQTSKPDFKGDASLSFADGVLSFVIKRAGAPEGVIMDGSFTIRLTVVALAATIPPLLLWGLWLWRASLARQKERV